jgi:sugar-specific transcriptional regulator TrmB
MTDLIEVVANLGLSTKAAKIYLAALELGEASVQQLAQKSRIKRTTLYYLLDELAEAGVLVCVKTGKKTYYTPEQPATLLKNAKEKIAHFEESLALLEEKAGYIRNKPRVYFLYGTAGFKEVWDMILDTKEKEYRIITQGENFLDYVKEKYILDEIIAEKKKRGVKSKQLITASAYAKQIVAKDARENRVSKFLPPIYKLPFTEIITESLVAFISPRFNNMIFVVENEAFARTRKSVFESLWGLTV